MTMRQSQTAVDSYRSIEPTLGARQTLVRRLLEEFHRAYAYWPTGKELLRFAVATHVEARTFDPNSVRPRLKELFDQGYVEHGAKRACQVTGKRVWTWQLKRRVPVAQPLPWQPAEGQALR